MYPVDGIPGVCWDCRMAARNRDSVDVHARIDQAGGYILSVRPTVTPPKDSFTLYQIMIRYGLE
ncbi:hypothetical protein [Paenibacillus pseudetheri]|uniref:hypothetical protein n=1 Tax=Paenibacillus pseudetheri TaxID=2897682 RepID=UPI003C6E8FB9